MVGQNGGLAWWADMVGFHAALTKYLLGGYDFISSSLLFGRSDGSRFPRGKKDPVPSVFEIEIAPGVPFHVFWDAVK